MSSKRSKESVRPTVDSLIYLHLHPEKRKRRELDTASKAVYQVLRVRERKVAWSSALLRKRCYPLLSCMLRGRSDPTGVSRLRFMLAREPLGFWDSPLRSRLRPEVQLYKEKVDDYVSSEKNGRRKMVNPLQTMETENIHIVEK